MPQRRNNWYNLHSTRRYPLDDKATGTGDDGVRLADDILTDLHLRYPAEAGEYAFLAGLTVTERLVTAVFMAADDLDNPTVMNPIAAVHVTRPAQEGIHIAVRPLRPGVGGFVVFGDTTELFTGRFSTPRQGLLAPRAARPYRPLPIPTLRRLSNNTGLTGFVRINGARDIEVTSESLVIDGHGRKTAMVLRLMQPPTGSENVLSKYLGPCDKRPESGNCSKPPLEAINGAVPDCSGNVKILVCRARSTPLESCGAGGRPGGMVLDHHVGMRVVCTADTPDRFIGHDLCQPSGSSLSSWSSLSSLSESSRSSRSSSSASLAPEIVLPYRTTFDNKVARYFTERLGIWSFTKVDSPAEQSLWELPSSSESSQSVYSSSSSVVVTDVVKMVPYYEKVPLAYHCDAGHQRNVAVFAANAYTSSLDKSVITDLRINAGPQENAGVIINWQITDPQTDPRETYMLALLDRREHALRLLRYTGTGSHYEMATARLPSPVVIGDWYRMIVNVRSWPGYDALIQMRISGISKPSWPTLRLEVPTNQFLADTGYYGLGSVRSSADFSFFLLEEI